MLKSIDGLDCTVPIDIGTFGPVAAYPTAVALGGGPHFLGQNLYVCFSHMPTDSSGWKKGELRRPSVSFR
jgi:hypothetical protein